MATQKGGIVQIMAVIHISEAEAARDLAAVLEKVRAGEEIRIESGSESFSVVRTFPEQPKPVLLSEAIRRAKEKASSAVLDPGFADDVMDGIRSHENDFLIDPWEAF